MLGFGVRLWEGQLRRPAVFPGATLDMNFAAQNYLGAKPSDLTVARASSGWLVDSAGGLNSFGNNVPRILPGLGLCIEFSRTNSIRNSTAVGAVVGTVGSGGALPTNWVASTNGSGLSYAIQGTGTESGMSYVDIRLFGTAGSVTEFFFAPEPTSGMAATNGQTWAYSTYTRVVAGSLSNITAIQQNLSDRQAAGAVGTWANTRTADFKAAALAATAVGQNKQNNIGTISDASAAFIWPTFYIAHGTGAVDITLRVGMQQCELGANVTSPIPTSTVAVTRATDNVMLAGAAYSAAVSGASGVWYAEGSIIDNTGGSQTRRLIDVTDGTANNRILLGKATTNQPRYLVSAAAATQADIFNTAAFATAPFKIAARFNANAFQEATMGVLGTPDVAGSVPTVTQCQFGLDVLITDLACAYGLIRRVAYIPGVKTDAFLQALSA